MKFRDIFHSMFASIPKAHVIETFTFQVDGKTTVVKGREHLAPAQLAVIEAHERHLKSLDETLEYLRKL